MSSTSLSLTTCVIGGAGFIGQFVVSELLEKGRTVIVLGRRPRQEVNLPTGVQYISTRDENSNLREILAKVDEIIDMAYATVPQTSFQDPVNDILVNLPETVRLFELAATLRIKKFLWLSSGGTVYGRTHQERITEDHPTAPISPYGITKLAIEKYAHMYFELKGLPIVCVRPANAFGAGQRSYSGQGFIATAIASIIDGHELMLFGEEGTIRDYLHVQDMAKGIVAALEYGHPGEVYNLGSGKGLSNKQILDMIAPLATEIKREVRIRVVPSRPFDVPKNVLDSSKLTQHTGWNPQISFLEALQHTWLWYTQQLHTLTFDSNT